MNFADFISPYDEQRFFAEHFDKAPLHVPASSPAKSRSDLIDWDRFLDLLDIVPQWQSGQFKMIMDSRPVAAEHYSATREAAAGPMARVDRALVEAMMALGASAVANGIEDVSSAVRRCCTMLGQRFAAKAGANIYASQAGVQAFASHCDPHEVFAVQCEGRKLWRIYGGRADHPVQATLLSDQAAIERAKGPLIMEVLLEAGDLLYLPRGFYHDAVAQGGRSLHLTFAVQPLHGIGLLDMLRDLAIERPEMRRYLAPAYDGPALAAQLEAIAREIALLLRSPAMIEDIAVRQRTMVAPATAPDTATPVMLVRTKMPCAVDQPLEGSSLIVGGRKLAAGLLSDTARWAFTQAAFTPAQCRARFSHHPAAEVDVLLAELVQAGALEEHPVQR